MQFFKILKKEPTSFPKNVSYVILSHHTLDTRILVLGIQAHRDRIKLKSIPLFLSVPEKVLRHIAPLVRQDVEYSSGGLEMAHWLCKKI